jgi:hypothetical protein
LIWSMHWSNACLVIIWFWKIFFEKKKYTNLIFYLLNYILNRMHFSPYLLACTFFAFAFRYELNAHVFSLLLRVHLTFNCVYDECSNDDEQPCAMNAESIYRYFHRTQVNAFRKWFNYFFLSYLFFFWKKMYVCFL